MNKKLSMFLFLLLLAAWISPVEPLHAQSGEWESFVSDDGRLAIQYPAGWLVKDQSGDVGVPAYMLANAPAILDGDSLQPGQSFLLIGLIPQDIFVNLGMTVDSAMPPDELTVLISGLFFSDAPGPATVAALSSGQQAGYIAVEDEANQGSGILIAFWQADIVVFVVVEAYAGEYTPATTELGLTVAGSVEYSGTGQDLLNTMGGGEDTSVDLSSLSYSEAFDTLLTLMSEQYIFAEAKDIDWDQKAAEYQPRFETAVQQQDREAYLTTLRDFAWSFHDGHVYSHLSFEQRITHSYEPGGLGLAVRELDDQSVVVTFVLEGGPGEQVGIEMQAEILQIDGYPVQAALDAANVPGGYGPAENRRLEQQRSVLRFQPGTQVNIMFQNPGSAEPVTVTLTAIEEQASLEHSSLYYPMSDDVQPAEFELLANSYGYVRLTSFGGNNALVIETWNAMLETLRVTPVPGLIVDLRQNGGGDGLLALQLASTFFTETIPIGQLAVRSEETGELEVDPDSTLSLVPPVEDQRYAGPVVVLIDPTCFSACEIFAYAMRQQDRAAVIGQYPTAGAFGADSIPVLMPEGEYFQFPIMATMDANNQIIIEDSGVAPTVRVPITRETLFSDDDPVLSAAVATLNAQRSR